MKPLHESDPEPDHHAPHHKRSKNSPNQDAMLGARRDPEIIKDQDENENVIDAERVFDDVAGQKIEPRIVALRFPDEHAKPERKHDPDQAALDRGPHAQLAGAPLELRQVDPQRDEDAHVKGHPKPNIRGHRADGSISPSAPQRQIASSSPAGVASHEDHE